MKHLVSVLMCYLRHLDGIPKKWPVSRQLPFKNEPEIFWPVDFPHISFDEKISRHSQLFSWAKTISVKEKWDEKVFMFFSFIAAVPSAAVFV